MNINVPHTQENLVILGSPIGDKLFSENYISKKYSKWLELLTNLRELGNLQIELILLRYSMSFSRIVYILRTTPFIQVDEFIKDFDERVIGAFEGILGENNLDDNTRVQVSLPMKMGGCGIRAGCVHHSAAYDNSYKQFLGKETPEQKTLSAGIDKMRKEELTAALDEENVFRLALISRERVSSWLSDVPIYGAGLEWSNVHFRVLLRWWLGLKVSEVGECNLSKCKGHMSPTGKHALACKVGGDMVTRHNRIRDCVYNIAKEGALAPVKEKYGLLSDAPENRPLNGINNLC